MWLKYSESPLSLEQIKADFGEIVVQDTVDRLSFYAKPKGVWITDDSEHNWKSWCEAEDFEINCLAYRHKVVLDESKILFIRTPEQLIAFTNKYGRDCKLLGLNREPDGVFVAIDWAKVAQEYDGIIITPYIYQHRLDQMWYYGWDCASGCIWNLNAIKSIRPVGFDYKSYWIGLIDGFTRRWRYSQGVRGFLYRVVHLRFSR